jgi:hypothetical protein
MSITEVKQNVSDFLMQTLKASDVRVVGCKKVPDGWEAEVEVYEESAFIKALGLPVKVRDRNLYVVKENDELQVLSFERKDIAKDNQETGF